MHDGILPSKKVAVVRIEAEGVKLRGYGRKEGKGAREEKEREGKLTLSLEEAAFLLEAGNIVIKKEEEKGSVLTLEEFFRHALEISPNFGTRYIVYKDLKERGYAVHPGGVEFWLYPRGTKPGEKPARYYIRILSEHEFLSVKDLEEFLMLAHNMRKELIIAVVDDESDITYYRVKEAKFETIETQGEEERWIREEMGDGNPYPFLLGDKVVLQNVAFAEALYKNHFYGRLTKEGWLLLSPVEAAYLMKKGLLEMKIKFKQFIEYATALESDFMNKYAVYEDLMERGVVVKTGFKFGSHFRVYKYDKGLNLKHSSDLIHVLPRKHVFLMPELARAVRLAHGVKKRMIFAYQPSPEMENSNKGATRGHLGTVDQAIRYIDIRRMKL